MSTLLHAVNLTNRIACGLIFAPTSFLAVKNGLRLKEMFEMSSNQKYMSPKLKEHIYLWISCFSVSLISLCTFITSFPVFPNDAACNATVKIIVTLYGINAQVMYLFLLLRANILGGSHSEFYDKVRKGIWYSVAIFAPVFGIPLGWWV